MKTLVVSLIASLVLSACGSDGSSADPDAPVAVIDAANIIDSAIGSADANANADATANSDDAMVGVDDAAVIDGMVAMADAAVLPPDAMAPLNDANTSIPPTTFRVDQLFLRDPHAYFPCTNDITDDPIFGISANGLIADGITMDGDDPPDGFLDLNVVGVFRPLDQASSNGNVDVGTAACTTANSCVPGSPPPTPTTYTNVTTGQCLGLISGTTEGFTPPITIPTDNCFYAEPVNLTVNLGGAVVNFTSVQVAAEYVGSPATELQDGMIRGFLSLNDAMNALIPFPVLGPTPLSDLLQGGGNCGMASDLDDGPGCTQCGWWFYFNFHAVPTTYTEP